MKPAQIYRVLERTARQKSKINTVQNSRAILARLKNKRTNERVVFANPQSFLSRTKLSVKASRPCSARCSELKMKRQSAARKIARRVTLTQTQLRARAAMRSARGTQFALHATRLHRSYNVRLPTPAGVAREEEISRTANRFGEAGTLTFAC